LADIEGELVVVAVEDRREVQDLVVLVHRAAQGLSHDVTERVRRR
jgi:hypothetical protein